MAATVWKGCPGERTYSVLLFLYPAKFRLRFGVEMRQLFRDCSRNAVEDGGVLKLAGFWIRTLGDLVVSLAILWPRELVQPIYTGLSVQHLADSLAVPMVIVSTLMVAGHIGPVLMGSVAQWANTHAGHESRTMQLLTAAGITACVLGVGGTLSALVVARSSRTQYPWLKLSAIETTSKKENA